MEDDALPVETAEPELDEPSEPDGLDDEAIRAHPAFQAAVAAEVARYRRRARRWWLVGLGVPVTLGVLLFLAFAARVALFPTIDTPGQAQAIFVLGGPGNRIAKGLELARQGLAPVVVVSQPGADALGFDYLPICQDKPTDIEVRCVDPGDQRTADEAEMITQQTYRNGWGSIIVVAGEEQVTRARMIIRRCFPNTMWVVGADRGRSVPAALLYEGVATIRALIFRSEGC